MNEKRMAIVCFTLQANLLAEKIKEKLKGPHVENEWNAEIVYKPKPFSEWLKEHFEKLDALVFIGAMGIIVRDMSPYLKSKLTDPAVVVLDEKGQFAVSVLSGHLGGANALARDIAGLIGAMPVVTTSSDVNGKIAIDVFAKNNHLSISSMEQAKFCAAKIVAEEPVSFYCEKEILGKIPLELSAKEEDAKFHVRVTPYTQKQSKEILHLVPKAFVVGIGCKKGISSKVIEQRVKEELKEKNIDFRSIKGIASIDLKKEEEGLLVFAEEKQLPLHFYNATELSELEGDFTKSQFVSQITGVENVCERSAFMLARKNGMETLEQCMVLPKSGKDGVTIAIMRIDWRISFE